MSPGDQVLWGGRTFTLIERRFTSPGQTPMWLVVETDSASAQPRLLVEEELTV
jgi:hypothetical protein